MNYINGGVYVNIIKLKFNCELQCRLTSIYEIYMSFNVKLPFNGWFSKLIHIFATIKYHPLTL